jgi:hypothetical protein
MLKRVVDRDLRRALPASLAAACWLLAAGGVAFADGDERVLPRALAVQEVRASGALVLRDGRELCLAGIATPSETDWRAGWLAVIDDDRFFHRHDAAAKRDRYGCLLANVWNDDGLAFQEALLTAGWAVVDPQSVVEDEVALDDWLEAEDEARRKGRGLWQVTKNRAKAADDLGGWIGTRQLVEGRVRRVSVNDRYVYLNFGADWRTDFTARLERKMTDRLGVDVDGLRGKALRVRGVLEESRGPLIHISHIKQIEYLP